MMRNIALFLALAYAATGAYGAGPPNFVIIFTDDQGYGDIGCYGAEGFETPHLDRMAAEGMRFTDFYSAAPICTPSRAALLTGCYPLRVSLPNVLHPPSNEGLHPDEITLAELLKTAGYATGCFGKWHLGHRKPHLPVHHGFDEYFGLPYSNDMWPEHLMLTNYPDLPLIEGDEAVAFNPDQRLLTTRYTERAAQFIEKRADKPFFLYLAHSMPHVPLFVSEKFAGKSALGLYGDVMMEIDWSVGQVLDALKRKEIDDKTLVVFTSDNGPWLLYGDHAGSAGPLREGKMTTFDGGQRSPCIMRWPETIPAGSLCREACGTIDLLPTFAALAGVAAPADRRIDGKDIRSLLAAAPGAAAPHEAIYFYRGNQLQAVRSGPWKLHLPHKYKALGTRGAGGKPGRYVTEEIALSLFDMRSDPGESKNVADSHAAVVKQLRRQARFFDRSLKKQARPHGEAEPEP